MDCVALNFPTETVITQTDLELKSQKFIIVFFPFAVMSGKIPGFAGHRPFNKYHPM